MITSCLPNSWEDLQLITGKILEQCGFDVEVEKTIKTVRGNVEIDVYAEEEVNGRKYSIICECKYWKANVPQNVVHGLRTVINDIGSNIGYLITTSNFQSGAIVASSFTNIKLLNWAEFQNAFFESWYENYFAPTLTKTLDPLFTYTEPILPGWFSIMSEDDKKLFIELKNKYDIFGVTMFRFSTYSRMLDKMIPLLPLRERLELKEDIIDKFPKGILDESYYNDFLEQAIAVGKEAIEEFRRFRYKYSNDQYEEE